MNNVSAKHLNLLIQCLQDYKKRGVTDPWVLDDGTEIEPLSVLTELKALRNAYAKKIL